MRLVVNVGKTEREQVVQVLEAPWFDFLDKVGSQFLRLKEGGSGGAWGERRGFARVAEDCCLVRKTQLQPGSSQGCRFLQQVREACVSPCRQTTE